MLFTMLELAVPELVRALTFYLDRQWGEIVLISLAPFTPRGSVWMMVLFTVVLTLAVGQFEKWAKAHLTRKSRQAISKPVVEGGLPMDLS